MHRRHLRRGDVGARRLARGREIDRAHRHAVGAQPIADEAQFGAFGVESPDDERRAADALREGHGQQPDAARRTARGGRAAARLAGRTQAPAVRQMIGAIDRRIVVGRPHRRRGPRGTPEPRRRRRRRRRQASAALASVSSWPCRPTPSKLLLQLAVGGERARVHDAVDAPVDHDRDMVGDRGRDADVLLDDEDGKILLVRETDQKIPHLRRRSSARGPRSARP